MAAPVHKIYALKGGTTGTTGIIKNSKDVRMWRDRVELEDPVHSKVNPDGFAMRYAFKNLGIPLGPQNMNPSEGGHLDFASLGWDPEGKHAKDVEWLLHRGKSVPRDRFALQETMGVQPGFIMTTPNMAPGIPRSHSMPGRLEVHTQHPQFAEKLNVQADRRHARRERKLAEAEASIAAKLQESGRYFNHCSSNGMKYRGRIVTDASGFDEFFIKANCGRALFQTRPSDVVTLKQRNGLYADLWAP